MDVRSFLEALHVAERLKDTIRHCTTSKHRPESVAEHSWRMVLMAYFLQDEFPQADMNRVMKMCLIHDLGEAFTGDIPVFAKTAAHEKMEEQLLNEWVSTLPEALAGEMQALYEEMNARETLEAKIYKAIDSLEAVIQHNESPIDTWEPHEYELNKTYAFDEVKFSDWLTRLREEILKETVEKTGNAGEEQTESEQLQEE